MDRVEGGGDNGKPGRAGRHPRLAVTGVLISAVGALVITPRDLMSQSSRSPFIRDQAATSGPISDTVTMDDFMITFDTPTASLRQATYGFRQAMRLDTIPVLRTNHHPNSSSEQMPYSREEGEMGTQLIQNPLLARTTDTSLSLNNTSDIQTESPSRYTDERIQSCLRKTLNDQKSDPCLDTEGVHSMDTLKKDEPIALQTRHKFKLQYPSKPRKDTIRLDKTDTNYSFV